MLEEKYDLCYAFQPEEYGRMVKKMEELLSTADLKRVWQAKRERFISAMIDPTAFLVRFIENYPTRKYRSPEDKIPV
jgi:predicted glycosyltransferase